MLLDLIPKSKTLQQNKMKQIKTFVRKISQKDNTDSDTESELSNEEKEDEFITKSNEETKNPTRKTLSKNQKYENNTTKHKLPDQQQKNRVKKCSNKRKTRYSMPTGNIPERKNENFI